MSCDDFIATPLLARPLRGRAQLAARYREERWVRVVGDDNSPDRIPIREYHSVDTELWLSHYDRESSTKRAPIVNAERPIFSRWR